jgi:membrane-associated phospholipid phosphatase
MRLVAQVISRVFDPIVEIPLMLGLAVWNAYVNGMGWQFLLVLLFIDAILPFLFFLHLLRRHEVDNWDISKREQRIPVYGFTMLAHLAGVGLAWVTGRMEVALILFVFWLLGMAFFGLTTFWKVSVHAGVNSALVTFLVLIVDPKYAWLYVLLVPVGWARIYTKNHSLDEFMMGAILGSLGLWGGFKVFGVV